MSLNENLFYSEGLGESVLGLQILGGGGGGGFFLFSLCLISPANLPLALLYCNSDSHDDRLNDGGDYLKKVQLRVRRLSESIVVPTLGAKWKTHQASQKHRLLI